MSENYRLAVSGEKHLATLFATSSMMYFFCRPISDIAVVLSMLLLLYFSTSVFACRPTFMYFFFLVTAAV